MKKNFYYKFFKRRGKAFGTVLFIALLTLCNLQSPTAHAQIPGEVPVGDAVTRLNTSLQPSVDTKTLVGDPALRAAVRIILQNITNSVVTWINSGFQGNPAFISDPQSFFTDVGDQIAGDFINHLDATVNINGVEYRQGLGFLCEPFSLDIKAALALNYSSTYERTNYCRLSGVISNVENFTRFTNGDFSQGGWDSWFQISQNPDNNPVGAYLAAQSELSIRTARGQNLKLLEANWGQGFLSSRDCVAYEANPADTSNPRCVQYGPIKTPGTVIESQLETTLGTNLRQYELAKNFDEIVNALVGQLIQNVLTKGLSSFGAGGSNYHSLQTSQASELTVSCSADKSSAAVGELVTWYAYISGGTDTSDPTFAWHGNDLVNGATSQTVYVGYSSPGIKTASVNVAKGNQSVFQICSSQVTVHE